MRARKIGGVAALRAEVAAVRSQLAVQQRTIERLCAALEVESPQPTRLVDTLTPKDVAFITGLSRSAVQKRMENGKYKVVTVGGRRFVDPRSL